MIKDLGNTVVKD